MVANAGSGAIVDISGRYISVACFSLVAGAAALVGVGIAPNALWLVPAIIIIGLTNNLWHPAAISYLSQRYPDRRGFALALHTLGATFGDMLAPVCAGILLVWLSWQGTANMSAIPVVIVAITLGLALPAIRADAAAGRRSPEAEQKCVEPTSPGDQPGNYLQGMIDMASNPAMMKMCVMSGLRSMTQNGLMMFLPLYLVNILFAKPQHVGFAMMAFQIGGIFSGPLAGSWSDRIGRQPVCFAGLLATTVILCLMCLTTNATLFVVLVCALGFAMFSVRPVIHGWAMDLSDAKVSGSAVSLLFAVQSAFTMIVPIAGGLVADHFGLQAVLYVLLVTIIIATALTYTLTEARNA